MTDKKRLLVLGANGMLGNAVLRWFARNPTYEVTGSVRRLDAVHQFQVRLPKVRFVDTVNAEELPNLRRIFSEVRPDIVINCVGVVRQLAGADDPAIAIPINALLPHRLAKLSEGCGARLVHISTDCVFSGDRGSYTEDDLPDAIDLYGRSKLMGEVDYPHAMTLRTSIIGHELNTGHGLVGWFLSQRGPVRGFSRAIFSALPTVELARVIERHVLPHPELHGTYHVSAEPISKHDLLELVAREYRIGNQVQPDTELVMDRSLNSARFRQASGYEPPSWPELVSQMREFG